MTAQLIKASTVGCGLLKTSVTVYVKCIISWHDYLRVNAFKLHSCNIQHNGNKSQRNMFVCLILMQHVQTHHLSFFIMITATFFLLVKDDRHDSALLSFSTRANAEECEVMWFCFALKNTYLLPVYNDGNLWMVSLIYFDTYTFFIGEKPQSAGFSEELRCSNYILKERLL